MSTSSRHPARALTALLCAALAALALGAPAGSSGAVAPKPRVATGAATHVLATSALLTAVINPNGVATSYYFQYGPTLAYGLQTPTLPVGTGTSRVKLGQLVSGLSQGTVYHYRVVAVYGSGLTVAGHDRTFAPRSLTLKVELDKLSQVPVGTPFILSGTIKGFGAAGHRVQLQASPFPYLESFAAIGLPAVSNALGRFAFRVANLAKSTQFRVITLDPRPLFSPTITVHAAVRVTLHARSSGTPGLVRVYGTVTPAVSGARVIFQVEKATRPPKGSESEEPVRRFISQFATTVKKGTRASSRFSLVVSVRHGGRYRALVSIHTGPYVSGISAQTVVLRAAKPKARRKH